MIVRPRRSVLYTPGSNARALDKVRLLPVDAVILDLEDSVAPAGKANARAQVIEAIAAGGFGPREVVVRINGLDTEWWLDTRADGKPTPENNRTNCPFTREVEVREALVNQLQTAAAEKRKTIVVGHHPLEPGRQILSARLDDPGHHLRIGEGEVGRAHRIHEGPRGEAPRGRSSKVLKPRAPPTLR